ncbi:MAG: 30S ribosome-binding factor RbfA [Acidobacteriota bacterium]
MKGKRTERVADLFRKEISDIILKEVKDPGVGFITVTGVDVSRDLKHARVYISSIEKDAEMRGKILAALERASGFIRHRMYKNLRLKYSPELRFLIDESIDTGFRIDEILKEMGDEEGKK